MKANLAKWEQTRRQGRERFIWRVGVCGFGLTIGVLGAAVNLAELVSSRHPGPWIAIVALLLGPIAGYIWGRLVWNSMETEYLAACESARAEQARTAAIEGLTPEVNELRAAIKE